MPGKDINILNLLYADKEREGRGVHFHGIKWNWNRNLFVSRNIAPALSPLLISQNLFFSFSSLPSIFSAVRNVRHVHHYSCHWKFISSAVKKNRPSSPKLGSESCLSNALVPCNTILHYSGLHICVTDFSDPFSAHLKPRVRGLVLTRKVF